MRLSCGHEIDDTEIMSAAAGLRSRMRKTYRGGHAPKVWTCPRCGSEHLGQKMLWAHFTMCSAPPPSPVGEADLRAMAVTPGDLAPLGWTPDQA
jgi:hypothetical protein